MNILRFILFIPLLTVMAAGCKKEEKKAPPAAAVPTMKAAEVLSLQPVKPVVLPGELHPWDRVSIYSKVNGFVKEVKADRGTVVKKGQVLAILDAPEVLTELDKARGQLHASEAALQQAKAVYAASDLTYRRLQKASSTPGAVAANELDQAKSRMMSDSSAMVTAEGNLKAARSHYHTKSELKNYLTITAPFSGTIIERNISPGSLIGAGQSNKPMFVLEDISTLRLTIAIPEHYANALSKTSAISFTVNAVPDKAFNARFGRSSESIVEKNRVMISEFDVDNRNGELKAGMYAEVQIPIKRTSPTLFVPKSSVVSSSERVFVIKAEKDKSEWVNVKKGITLDTLTEVFGDIEAGELIVKDASEELREGQQLKIIR